MAELLLDEQRVAAVGDEVGEVIGTTPVSVRVTQHRALKKLRSRLGGGTDGRRV